MWYWAAIFTFVALAVSAVFRRLFFKEILVEESKGRTALWWTPRRLQTLRIAVVGELKIPDKAKRVIWSYLDDYLAHFAVTTGDGRCRFFTFQGVPARRKQRVSHNLANEFRVLNDVREIVTYERVATLHRTEKDPRGKYEVYFGSGDLGHRSAITAVCKVGIYFVTAGGNKALVYSRQDLQKDPSVYTPTPLYVWTHPDKVLDARACEHDVFTACRDGIVRQWSIKTGIHVESLSHHGEGNSVFCVAVDDAFVVSGGSSRKLHVWDRHAREEKILVGHTDWITSLAMNPKHPVCASCGGVDQTVRLWNLVAGHMLWSWTPNGNEPVNTVVWGEVLILALDTCLFICDPAIASADCFELKCDFNIVRTISLPRKIISLSL